MPGGNKKQENIFFIKQKGGCFYPFVTDQQIAKINNSSLEYKQAQQRYDVKENDNMKITKKIGKKGAIAVIFLLAMAVIAGAVLLTYYAKRFLVSKQFYVSH